MSRAKRQYVPKPREEVKRNMSSIRATGNRVETLLRQHVHRRGLRFRKYARSVLGRPDFVFPTEKVAVFVDGDFWHGRTLMEGGMRALRKRIRTPNQAYWIEKFTRRVERDREVTEQLTARGWIVLRFWESDLEGDIQSAVDDVVTAVESRR